jgi:hypothetical protein
LLARRGAAAEEHTEGFLIADLVGNDQRQLQFYARISSAARLTAKDNIDACEN